MNKLKILIVCVSFPPLNESGSTRPYTWAKYLGEENDVKVFTPKKTPFHGSLDYFVEKKNYEIFEYEGLTYIFMNISKSLNRILVKIHYIEWALYIIFSQLFKNNKYDYVISTYNTWHCHFIGYFIKRFNISRKWIADYRDLWNNTSLIEYRNKYLLPISSFFEKVFMRETDAITSVSEPLVSDLKDYLKLDNVIYKCIYNGFEYRECKVQIRSPKIILSHTGSVWKDHRDPSLLFEAIKSLIEKKGIKRSIFKLKFVGDITGNVIKLAQKYEIEDLIEITGHVNRKKSHQIQQNSDFLILLNSGRNNDIGIMTGKIFEYISSGVPILGIGFSKNNVAGKLIHNTNTGRSFTELDKLEKTLHDYLLNKELEWFNPKLELIYEYHSQKQVKKLQDLLYLLA